MMVTMDNTWVTSYSTSIDHNIVACLSPFVKYLACNFNDLDLELFKVIQGQSHDVSRKPIDGFLCYLHCV